MIKIKNATKKGYIEIIEGGVLDLSFPESETRRGRVIDGGNVTPTLDTGCEVGVVKTVITKNADGKEPYQQDRVYDTSGISPALCQNKADLKVLQVGQIYGTDREPNPQAGRVYSQEGISPCLDTMGGGNRQPKVLVKGGLQEHQEWRKDDVSPTLTSAMGMGGGNTPVIVKPCLTPDRTEKRQNGRRFKEDGEEMFTLTAQDKHGVLLDDGRVVRIRRLTPKECFRLQGWSDDYFEKAAFVNSDSQLYKQAGNGVTVDVVEEIGKAIAEVENDDK